MQGVKLLRVHELAKVPTKGTAGSAYYDVYAVERTWLGPQEVALLQTGWKIEVPSESFLDIRTRSGMACQGIIVANAPGTVDADYRGELCIILANVTRDSYVVMSGDRIAQVALMPVRPTSFEVVAELSSTERGEGGYGSTGR